MSGEDYISLVAKQLAESLEAEQCTIRIPSGKTLQLVAAYGVQVEKREKQIPLSGTVAGETVMTGKIICIPDISKDERYCHQFATNGRPRSMLAVPFKFEENRIGVAQIYSKTPFSEKQIFLAESLVQFAGLALRYEQFSKMSRRAILEVANAIIEDLSFKEIFQHTAQEMARILRIDRCSIYRIFEKSNEEIWCEITAGWPIEDHGIGLQAKISDHPDIHSAVVSKKIQVIISPTEDPRTVHFRKIIESKMIHQILYVPVLFNGRVSGVIVIDASGEEKHGFTVEEIVFCSEVAELIALILGRDGVVHQELRHEVINRIVTIGGYTKLMLNNLKSNDLDNALRNALKVREEVTRIEASIPMIKNPL